MVSWRAVVACATLLLVAQAPGATAVSEADKFRYVSCNSLVKLTHEATGYVLHSHEVSYGSGSGQQSVTGFPEHDDANSYWQVLGTAEKPCKPGQGFRDGDKMRLRHLATGKYLHSHRHASPMSRQQEVSCFAGEDSGDVWRLVCQDNAVWGRDERIRLQHVDTRAYLSISPKHKYGNPIPGQLEVSGGSHADSNTVFIAEAGIYFAAESL